MRTHPTINKYKVTDTTSISLMTIKAQKVKIDNFFDDILCRFGFKLFCSILPGQPGQDAWETKYIDPVIKAITYPTSLDNVNFYVVSGYMTGDITTVLDNKQSTNGRTYEQNTRTGEKRNDQEVYESSTINHEGIAKHVISKLNELISDNNIVNKSTDVRQVEVSMKAIFKKDGYYNMLKNIYDYFMSGSVNIDSDINVTITYEWNGTQTKTQTIKINVDLPVKNVNWHLW